VPSTDNPEATIQALNDVGVDFSVSKTSLLSFLRNAEFTPFPAIADALLKRLNGRKLRQPVFIDVIVFNYEHTPGVESPRLLEDVDTAVLEAAVVEGSNERYGADKTDFESLLQKLTTTPTTPVVDLSTLPQRLQFRLRNFIEEEATDSGLQGPTDETFISGIGADSGAVFMGQDRKLEPELIKSGPVGRVKDLRAAWRVNPHVLLDFNLRRQAEWPRTFAATLLIVEEDDGDVGTDFAKAEAEVDKQIKDELNEAAESAVSAALSAIGAGALAPILGPILGKALGGLAGDAFDSIFGAIVTGLNDDVFTPRVLTLEVADPAAIRQHPDIDKPQELAVAEHGARYKFEWDWHLVE
jgi:hypothetical protein